MKVSVFIATSLDGFIARRDGSIDWLNEANAVVPEGKIADSWRLWTRSMP